MAAVHGGHGVTPRWICEICTALVPVTGAAIVEMLDLNRRQMVYVTDAVAEALEALQFTLGEGPCVQALETGRPVLVSDLHEIGHIQWPMFAEGHCCVEGKWSALTAVALDQMAWASSANAAGIRCLGLTSPPSS